MTSGRLRLDSSRYCILISQQKAKVPQLQAVKQLHVVFNVTRQTINIGGIQRYSTLVNGSLPGPTIRIPEEKVVWVRVYNEMTDDNLTMHWHGLAQAAYPFSDGTPMASQWPIPPSHFFDYELKTARGTAGTYYYHSHVGFQASSATGALIVEDPGQAPYAYDEERLIFLQEFWPDTDDEVLRGLTATPRHWPGEPLGWFVNGKTARRGGSGGELGLIEIEPGKTYRLRFVAATALSMALLGFEHHRWLYVIQADGGYTKQHGVNWMQLGSGQRYDVLLHAKTCEELRRLGGKMDFYMQLESRERVWVVTSYAMLRYRDTCGFAPINGTAGRLPVGRAPETRPMTLPPTIDGFLDYALEPLDEGDEKFPTAAEVTRRVVLHMQQFRNRWILWLVNKESWTESGIGPVPSRTRPEEPYLVSLYQNQSAHLPDYEEAIARGGLCPKTRTYPARIGEVLEVVLQQLGARTLDGSHDVGNLSAADAHPWHAHGPHFWDAGGGPGAWSAAEAERRLEGKRPVRRDTTLLYRYGAETVPPGSPAGWRLWRMRISQPGVWMVHCHTLQHMMQGMQTVWVHGDAADLLGRVGRPEVDGYLESNQDITNQAVLEVSDRLLYDIENNRAPYRHGPLDPRLGTSSKSGRCATCHNALQHCTGHFGHVRLPLPAFHVGYLRFVITILQNICKDCGRVLLEESDRQTFLRDLRRPFLDNLRRTQICKRINEQCRKAKTCPYCGSINGQIRKVGVLKLAHDKFVTYNKSTSAKKIPPESKVKFDESFAEAKRENSELEKHLRKAMEDLNPLRVLNLFKMISPSDCELLGLDPAEGRPEMFIWQFLPAPPICIRPSVAQDNASTEDDITTKLADIVWVSGMIRSALQKGSPIQTIMEQWEYLQTQIAMYVNSDVPGLQQPGFGKPSRGFCQRLKGKQGRFRGNLSGKRVDFSGRTVISPDPNLGVDQVAVPVLVAKNMTYPERVNRQNIEKLRQCIRNGIDVWPGAKAVLRKEGDEIAKYSLAWVDRERQARSLAMGDVVERHLEDGDIVLFNRQPSLHKLSIMSHLVKVRPWRTFRLNECVCNPYNADFDGDEMNLHVPQTEEARAEAINLMGVKYNLATPKNGEPIIAATQDFITAAFLLSSKDRFFDCKTFAFICTHMLDGKTPLDIPPPAILKPRCLWTGKQVFNVLMRPNKSSPVKVNLDAKCRAYKARPGQCPDMDPNDGWLVVRNSEIMCGRMDKSTVGSGKKDSVFYVILRDFGPDEAVAAMNRLAKLCARLLGNKGFSIGVIDVFPTVSLTAEKMSLASTAYKQCDDLIETFKRGKLDKAPGCNMEQTLENLISGILSKVRQQAGTYCIDTLSRNNAPLIMAQSGSKGSDINVAQMVAVVGQQIIGGQRVPDGFQDRSLPQFHKNARQPPSKGFVRNSFYTGLYPTEFLCHAVSGREGLVDTAVKTAETGYMSRRLMKTLEDLSTQYDDTVRTSGGVIVQFQFGADKLDPVDMEGSAEPVHFQRTWTHAENLTRDNDEETMTADEVRAFCDSMIEVERRRFPRRGLISGELLDYEDTSDYAIDEHEGARRFLNTIESYVESLASKLERVRELAGGDAAHVDRTAKVTSTTLRLFIRMCLEKYKKAHVEPGHAVGAVGAQSIGEPGTQMTLKTFHFAGVAGMSITQGVPRIKEIIGASKKISTPVITCPLLNKEQIEAAKMVKGRIEKTYISDVVHFVEDEWRADEGSMVLQIDRSALSDMHLGIGMYDIAVAICKHRKLKLQPGDLTLYGDRIVIRVRDLGDATAKARTSRGKTAGAGEGVDMLLRANFLRRMLPTVPISGYAEATRAIIQTSEQNTHMVLVEGYGLRDCMTTEGVIGTQTRSNHVNECYDVLGVEAARSTIANEIGEVMGDMGIDPRHIQLLADVMTYKGEILGISRFGLQKMRDSVLQLASFEKTPDHLFDAAAGMKTDRIEGVSECIIMGQTMSVGTGAFQVVRRLAISPHDLVPKPTLFEDAWSAEMSYRKGARRKGGVVRGV
ncbi:hypothetical protein L249_0585 [Ophiocordyceps polyrhachis-furcata BCC 54312]|uniref:DNA-directed RNA polymerase subunit n=1 Tax=Ophiocordyceps polyrhachis-furcata BCC 54312 TaxID=1330021 RepID=A0A367LER8_9HYPO|nr:hypothetical protein L249_0585 [Ophiocordyceps polyrhachis-furcata BCC 54312]